MSKLILVRCFFPYIKFDNLCKGWVAKYVDAFLLNKILCPMCIFKRKPNFSTLSYNNKNVRFQFIRTDDYILAQKYTGEALKS